MHLYCYEPEADYHFGNNAYHGTAVYPNIPIEL